MLFLSDAIYDARRRVLKDSERGKLGEEEGCRRMLELYAADHAALVGMARLGQAAGDLSGAEAYLWDAIEAQPCLWTAYLDLSQVLESQTGRLDLALGLGELAFSKILMDPEELGRSHEGVDPVDEEVLPGKSKAERIGYAVDQMRSHRDLESLDVTARLRPYRLIHQLQEGNGSRELVDALLREGDSMVPLLVGVLRGWAQEYLTEEDESSVESALALLGEMGGAPVIPHLLEFTVRDHATLSAAAHWALNRIIDLHPGEARRVLSGIASSADGRERVTIAEKVLRHTGLDPSGSILVHLTENLDRIPKADLGVMFPALITVMIAAHGRPGLERARATLRRSHSLLSRTLRTECEGLIEIFTERAIPPPPVTEPSPWTVYDICAGMVSWEEEDEDEDADNEADAEVEPFEPPQPVRKRATPGRNDPCWCGSGKKYKKCHRDSDASGERIEPTAPLDEFDDLRGRLLRFLPEAAPISDSRKAFEEFLQDRQPDQDDEVGFLDWLIHDWNGEWTGSPLRRGVIQEFLRRKGPGLSQREREILESWSRSFVGLYEVLDVRVGSGVDLRDVLSGDAFFVHDVNLSNGVVRWDGLLVRVVQGARGPELNGVGLGVPRPQIEPMREWMEEDQLRTGLPWPEYLKRNLPRIRRQPYELRDQSFSSLRLNNTDGEEYLLAKAVLRILDPTGVLAALKSKSEIMEEEDGAHYVWLSASRDEEEYTVWGHIRIDGDQLSLECNSKPRLERGRKLLAGLAGPALKHLRDEFTSQEELKRRALEEPRSSISEPDPSGRELERQVVMEHMERHYAKWPDMALPALKGKTPREAVKTRRGKLQVAALLRDFENGEEHKRRSGKPAYDIARLRSELGLGE